VAHTPVAAGAARGACILAGMPLTEELRRRLADLIAAEEVVLFMKGNRLRPQCGFSAGVVATLDARVADYKTVDVLADPELRDGIKEFSQWPTIPQLYVKGEFVGGADIVREMEGSGELDKLLGGAARPVKTPTITVSPAAAAAFREAVADAGPGEVIRLEISPGFEHGLSIEAPRPGDLRVDADGLAFAVARLSAGRADGLRFDFIEQRGEAGFKIENPNAPPTVETIAPAELAARLRAGEVHLYDVRTPREREIARIEPSTLLDEAAQTEILALPRDTPLVFYCHHGVRSHAAADHFLQQGFRRVASLQGGIEAWSEQVDAAVPRY
jgi:monothiol glutaredoxin